MLLCRCARVLKTEDCGESRLARNSRNCEHPAHSSEVFLFWTDDTWCQQFPHGHPDVHEWQGSTMDVGWTGKGSCELSGPLNGPLGYKENSAMEQKTHQNSLRCYPAKGN